MTWPWAFGYVTIPWDAKAHFQPQIQFLADSLSRREWPWWNPFVFSGQPQVADPQSMIFSPPFVILAILNGSPSLWAVDITVLASMAAGGVGLMLWFRDRGWHWGGALIAALAFSFGAAMAWRIQHTGQVLSLAYWPWALLFLDRTLVHGRIRNGLMTGITAAAIVLGRDQVALLCLYVLAARTVWVWAASSDRMSMLRRVLPALMIGGAAAVALVVVPVLMTVLLAADSNRPMIDFEGAGRGSLHPALLLTALFPQLFGAAGAMADYWGPPSFAWQGTDLFIAQNMGLLYIGAVPLLLLTGAALRGELWAREIRFFTCALIFMLLYALGWYTPAFRVMYMLLPGVDLYRRPADAVFLVGALSAILAGYGAHRMLVAPWISSPRWQVLLTGGLIALAVGIAIILGWRLERLDRLAEPLLSGIIAFAIGGLALAWSRPRIALTPTLAVAGLAFVTTLDLAWNNGPTTSSALPPAEYDVLQPTTKNATIAFLKKAVVQDETRRDRIELAGLGFHWPNASMTHRLENTLGYNPVRLGLYSRATGADDHVGLPDQRKFIGLMPSYRSLMADLLGLRFIATGAPVETMDRALPPGALPLVARTADGWIYENANALPRVLFVPKAQSADFTQIMSSGRWPPFDPRTSVLIEGATPEPDRRPGSAKLTAYANTSVTAEVTSPDGGYLVLNDVWHPWWFATVDGQPAEIQHANVLFRAVRVGPGTHTVSFTFEPLRGLWQDLQRRLSRTSRG